VAARSMNKNHHQRIHILKMNQGNPHQFDSGCSGIPHGQKNALSSPECPGTQ
jgi:hypothetical protein